MKSVWKSLAPFLLGGIVSLSGVYFFNSPKHDNADSIMMYDVVGQTYYSCNIDGQQIVSEIWQQTLDERNLSDAPLLVVWFSSLGCSSCNEYVLNRTRVMEENGLPLLCFGADFQGKPYSSENIIYLARNEFLGLSVEELKIPFVFVYDNEVRHIFFPSSRNERAFEIYLNVVTERYGKD